MHEIGEWITPEDISDVRNKKYKALTNAITLCYENEDGASLHELTNLNFDLLRIGFVSNPIQINDDPHFLAKLQDALLPHVHANDETFLYSRLCQAYRMAVVSAIGT